MSVVEEVIGNKYEEMDVYEAVAHVCERLGWIEKDGSVSFGRTNYDYVTEAQFIAQTKPLMDEAGLVIHPYSTDVILDEVSGNVFIRVGYFLVASKYKGEGDRRMEISTVGSGSTSDDKGSYKAMTGAFKYALRQTFRVPTGDDPEKVNEPSRSFKDTVSEKFSTIGMDINGEDFAQALADKGLSMNDLDKPNKKTRDAVKSIFAEMKND